LGTVLSLSLSLSVSLYLSQKRAEINERSERTTTTTTATTTRESYDRVCFLVKNLVFLRIGLFPKSPKGDTQHSLSSSPFCLVSDLLLLFLLFLLVLKKRAFLRRILLCA